MKLTLNGKPYEVADHSSVGDLLKTLYPEMDAE